MTTDFSNKVDILGRFKILYQDTDSVRDFFEFNDIGIPLAYLASEGLCDISEDGKKYIAETWDLFLASLGVEDTGFEELDEVLMKAENKP
ncbi:hypothetical protein EB001_08305 [bacterium]|jgi:hypothetical protein|nr:hypothetical protein [bacterium]